MEIIAEQNNEQYKNRNNFQQYIPKITYFNVIRNENIQGKESSG
jgi:hypothetical protein